MMAGLGMMAGIGINDRRVTNQGWRVVAPFSETDDTDNGAFPQVSWPDGQPSPALDPASAVAGPAVIALDISISNDLT